MQAAILPLESVKALHKNSATKPSPLYPVFTTYWLLIKRAE